VDDVGRTECRPVDLRLEEHRVRPRQLYSVLHLAVDGQSHLLAAVAANRLDRCPGESVGQSPLHEGRDESVLRSGAVQALTRAESELVGGPINGNGKGPGDSSFVVTDQKEEIALQIVEDLDRAGDGDLQLPREGLRFDGFPGSDQPGDRRPANGVMLLGHEVEPLSAALDCGQDQLLPIDRW